MQESRQCYKLFIIDILFCNAEILLCWDEIIPCNRLIPSKRDKKVKKSSFKKFIEAHFNRSKMFLFFTTHMMSICEKKKLTNKFMEFHHFMKKAEDTAEDFFKLIGIYRSSRSQMFFKIGVLKTFKTFTGKPAL